MSTWPSVGHSPVRCQPVFSPTAALLPWLENTRPTVSRMAGTVLAGYSMLPKLIITTWSG